MLIVDLIIVGLTIAAAMWGYRQGLNSGALGLIGFGGGAIVGSRVAPLILDGGFGDPFAPVVALPGALLFGAIVAAAFERFGFGLARRIRLRGVVDGVGGALLAVCLGLVAVWILGALAARVDDLRAEVRDSRIIERLNAVLPPPGPLLHPGKSRRVDDLRVVTGPAPNIGPVDPTIARDPQVRAAAPSVVKILGSGCGEGRAGSGWIARDGIVVTNAHVVNRSDNLGVQLRGKGDLHQGEVIWFDEVNDIALVRAPGVSGVPALRLGRDPKGNTHVAALGYPRGGPYRVDPARTGEATRDPGLRIEGKPIKTKITPFRAFRVVSGSSGGPIVDRRGRVRTMVFALRERTSQRYGVPTSGIRRALRRAGPPVAHGSCS